MPEKRSNVAIGIDLGSSKCCVGVLRNGRVEILENERGSRITPSYVAFTESRRLFGDQAVDQMTFNPSNTIQFVKRFLGKRKLEEDSDLMVHNTNNVIQCDGRIAFQVEHQCEQLKIFPEQVAAMLIKKMKDMAESHVGHEISQAVISIPTSFNEEEKQAIVTAARICNLDVLSLINEPSAAALAYLSNKQNIDSHHALVFGFGGGYLDASVFHFQNLQIECLKNICYPFGGIDITNTLTTEAHNRFRKLHPTCHVGSKNSEKLKIEVEKAKKVLIKLPQTEIKIDDISPDVNFKADISQIDIEELLSDQWSGIRERLEEIKITYPKIEKVVLMGGSTRIAAIINIIESIFGAETLNRTINPDEAAAVGASLYAGNLLDEPSVKKFDFKCLAGENYTPNANMNSSISSLAKKVHELDERESALDTLINRMNTLEKMCYSQMKLAKASGNMKAYDICSDIVDWLSDNEIVSESEIQQREKTVDKISSENFNAHTIEDNNKRNTNTITGRTESKTYDPIRTNSFENINNAQKNQENSKKKNTSSNDGTNISTQVHKRARFDNQPSSNQSKTNVLENPHSGMDQSFRQPAYPGANHGGMHDNSLTSRTLGTPKSAGVSSNIKTTAKENSIRSNKPPQYHPQQYNHPYSKSVNIGSGKKNVDVGVNKSFNNAKSRNSQWNTAGGNRKYSNQNTQNQLNHRYSQGTQNIDTTTKYFSSDTTDVDCSGMYASEFTGTDFIPEKQNKSHSSKKNKQFKARHAYKKKEQVNRYDVEKGEHYDEKPKSFFSSEKCTIL